MAGTGRRKRAERNRNRQEYGKRKLQIQVCLLIVIGVLLVRRFVGTDGRFVGAAMEYYGRDYSVEEVAEALSDGLKQVAKLPGKLHEMSRLPAGGSPNRSLRISSENRRARGTVTFFSKVFAVFVFFSGIYLVKYKKANIIISFSAVYFWRMVERENENRLCLRAEAKWKERQQRDQ